MQQITPMVRNIILLNVGIFVIGFLLSSSLNGGSMTQMFGLYYIGLSEFRWYQIVTNFFLHATISHLMFNMFSLYSIGSLLERFWGDKRFLNFYLLCGLGASIFHELSMAIPVFLKLQHFTIGIDELPLVSDHVMSVSVGASGAILGLFTAVARLFPNSEFYLFFIPFPIKAKYLLVGFVAIDLFFGVADFQSDFIGHFAHLGGVLTALIILTFWQRQRNKFF